MTKQATAGSRKDLKKKMASVFGEKIKMLSPELRGVLLDDLVTALENRLTILNKANQNTQFVMALTEANEYETVKT